LPVIYRIIKKLLLKLYTACAFPKIMPEHVIQEGAEKKRLK
jgi:hypothetical protein